MTSLAGDVPLPFQYINAHDLQAEADKNEEEKDDLDKAIKKVDNVTNEPTGVIIKNGNNSHGHVNTDRTLHRSISTNNDEQDTTASVDPQQQHQQGFLKPRRKSRIVVHIQPYSPQAIESGQDLHDIVEETIVDQQQSRSAQVMDTHVHLGAPSTTKGSPPLTPESPRLLSITARRRDSCSDGPVLSTDAWSSRINIYDVSFYINLYYQYLGHGCYDVIGMNFRKLHLFLLFFAIRKKKPNFSEEICL